MASPYDAIVKKYASTPIDAAPAEQPAFESTPPKVPVSDDPYASVVSTIKNRQRETRLASNVASADAAIEKSMHPDVLTMIKDVAKKVPSAVAQVGKEAIQHPLKTAQSTVLGLMDVGPSIVNFLSALGTGTINTVYGTQEKAHKLPLPGESFNEYMERSDAQKAVTEGSRMFGGFELGTAVARGTGIPKALELPVGNVIGGQVILPPETSFKDRATYAAFDAAFGAAQAAAGRLFRGFTKKSLTPVPDAPTAPVQAVDGMPTPRRLKVTSGEPEPPQIGRKIQKMTPPEPPRITGVVYVPKKLGVNAKGEKIQATTEYNNRTGQAIIYYSKELDNQPDLRRTVLDHEEGHVMDKRVNEGRNLSAELQNPTQNETSLRNTLGPFARQTNQTVQEAATKLATDIESLSKGVGSSPAEKFANAYAAYRQNPEVAMRTASTFDSFMKHKPVEASKPIEKSILTAGDLKPKKVPEPISAKKAKVDQQQAPEKPPQLSKKAEVKVDPKPIEAPKSPKQFTVNKAASNMIAKSKAENKPLIIDPDELKKAVNDFDPKNHEIYSAAAKKLFTRALKEDKNKTVIFTAGGSGSGKSEILISNLEKDGFKGIVYDGTMREYASTISKIKEAKASGKDIRVRAVVTDVERAWKFTQTRGERTGRFIPKDFFIDAHIGFIQTLKQLVKEGEYVAVADTRGINSAREARLAPLIDDPKQILDILDGIKYTKAELNQRLASYEQPTKTKIKSVDRSRTTDGKTSKNNEIPGRSQTNDTVAKGRGSERKIVRTAPPKHVATEKPGAGRIASTGLRTGSGVNTKSFNPKKINAPQEVEDLFNKLGAENKNFASQRLSKGNDDIKDLARLTGLTEDELIAARPGSIANSETATAARQMVLTKAQDLMNTLKSIDVSVATPTQLKQIRDDFVKLVAMQKAVAGFRTEASNVFRSFGIELAAGENATLSELAGLLKKAGVASEGDVATFAHKVAKETTLSSFEKVREGVLSTWYSAILSGPKTTIRNVLSTGSNILTEIAAKMVNPKQWNEVVPAVSGLLRGLRTGLGEARDVLYGAPVTTKFMETGGSAARPEVFTGRWATYGTVVESVGRFLNAQDKLLSSGAREMERASLRSRGLEVSKAVEDAVTKAYGERTVYHGKPTGKIIGALREGAQALRRRFPESKFIIPFVDTVSNVMDRQFDYFPITAALRLKKNVISEQATRIMRDFELKEIDRPFIEQRLRDQQVGRLVLGLIVSSGALALTTGGRVSGAGPSNYSEKQQLMRTGWRPNSMKIGDTWVPYTYLGPLAGIFSMAGNVHDKVKYDNAKQQDLTSLIGNGIVGWTQTQLDASFLSGVSDLFDVLSGGVTPEAYMKRFVSGLVPIPALYSQTKDMIWRQQYQTKSIWDEIRKKLGLTEGLEVRLDQFGEPMTSDLIFGISPSQEKAAVVDRFLVQNELIVSIPSRSQEYSIPGAGKEKRELTPTEYTEYVRESGQAIYQELERRLPELQNLPADKQKATVESIADRHRKRIRGQILRAD